MKMKANVTIYQQTSGDDAAVLVICVFCVVSPLTYLLTYLLTYILTYLSNSQLRRKQGGKLSCV